MTYGFAISQQLELFLYSLGYGFTLGLYYRFIMTFRKEISEKKAAYMAFDIFFCVTGTVITFCFFLVYTDGQVRLAAIVAAVIGFIIYMFSADFIVKKLLHYPVKFIIRFVKLLLLPLRAGIHLAKKSAIKWKNKIRTCRQKKNEDQSTKKRRVSKMKIRRRKIKENV
ncbi:MAG: spore cortex biosynthesis protein YabQ [Acutalibacteraceae bacterium]